MWTGILLLVRVILALLTLLSDSKLVSVGACHVYHDDSDYDTSYCPWSVQWVVLECFGSYFSSEYCLALLFWKCQQREWKQSYYRIVVYLSCYIPRYCPVPHHIEDKPCRHYSKKNLYINLRRLPIVPQLEVVQSIQYVQRLNLSPITWENPCWVLISLSLLVKISAIYLWHMIL